MVVSNASRSQTLAEQVFSEIENQIPELVKAFTRTDYNKKKCHLNYLGELEWYQRKWQQNHTRFECLCLQGRFSVIYRKWQKVENSFVMEMLRFCVACCHSFNSKAVWCEKVALLGSWKISASIPVDTLICWKKSKFFQSFCSRLPVQKSIQTRKMINFHWNFK